MTPEEEERWLDEAIDRALADDPEEEPESFARRVRDRWEEATGCSSDRLSVVASKIVETLEDFPELRDAMLRRMLERLDLDLKTLFQVGKALPLEVLTHPLFEAKNWSGEIDFGTPDRFGNLNHWVRSLTDTPDFPVELSSQLYLQLGVFHEIARRDWSAKLVEQIARHRALSFDWVKAWVSRVAGEESVTNFFEREEVKGRELELVEALVAAPAYEGDREKFDRLVFRAFAENKAIRASFPDEAIALMLEAIRLDDRTSVTSSAVFYDVFLEVGKGAADDRHVKPGWWHLGSKTLDVLMNYGDDVTSKLGHWRSLPKEYQIQLAKGNTVLSLLSNMDLCQEAMDVLVDRLVSWDGSDNVRIQSWPDLQTMRTTAFALIHHQKTSFSTAMKLWDVKFSPKTKGKLRGEILNREDAPVKEIDQFVSMSNETAEDWEVYWEVGRRLKKPWRDRALERWEREG